jgi:CheY-like chemotaxis protein
MTPAAAITILMAEDDPDDRLMTQEAFRECGVIHDLRFVRDGEELMDYLLHRGEHAGAAHALPGLILLDLNMPRMDGREALREIRADPALRDIAVVVLTTSSAAEDARRARAEGVDDFMTKPVSFEGMLAMVRTLAKYLP